MRKIIFKKGGGGGFGPYSPPPGSAPGALKTYYTASREALAMPGL